MLLLPSWALEVQRSRLGPVPCQYLGDSSHGIYAAVAAARNEASDARHEASDARMTELLGVRPAI